LDDLRSQRIHNSQQNHLQKKWIQGWEKECMVNKQSLNNTDIFRRNSRGWSW
jgi:hypothetical protein